MSLSKSNKCPPESVPREEPLEYVLVENPKDLRRITGVLRRQKALGVDLEADSMFHYQEKVCLLQISTGTKNFVLDPLALNDLSPLKSIFADSSMRKVFHGADYDIRSLQRDFNIEVTSLFDTQIAARFLGMNEIGLASLLKNRLGIIIGKKYQKKDWSRRPLSEPMLMYAVQDAYYLPRLAKLLEKDLRIKGRLSWVEEECELLSKVSPAQAHNPPFFIKFKGARKLDPRALAILEKILHLRNDVARKRDLPPFKVLGSAPIMELAQKKPTTESALRGIKGISPRVADTFARPVLKRIHEALDQSEESLPFFPKNTPRRFAPKVTTRSKALKKWRDKRAVDLEVEAAIVCTNMQIHLIAEGNPKSPEDLGQIDGIRNWQKEFFGEEICSLLTTLK